jgi:hypothetical protein
MVMGGRCRIAARTNLAQGKLQHRECGIEKGREGPANGATEAKGRHAARRRRVPAVVSRRRGLSPGLNLQEGFLSHADRHLASAAGQIGKEPRDIHFFRLPRARPNTGIQPRRKPHTPPTSPAPLAPHTGRVGNLHIVGQPPSNLHPWPQAP